VLNYFRQSKIDGTYKESERIALNGFVYHSHSTTFRRKDGPRYWRCPNRKCGGSVKTDAAILHGEASKPHVHPPDEALVGKAIAECKLSDLARQRPDLRPFEVVNNILSELSPEVLAIMPPRANLLSRAIRQKKKPGQMEKYAMKRRVAPPQRKDHDDNEQGEDDDDEYVEENYEESKA